MNKKVKIIGTGEIGLLKEIYTAMSNDREIGIIQLKDGSLTKALLSDIEILEDLEKPIKKNTVEIDEDTFRDLVLEKSIIASKGDFDIGYMYLLFGEILTREIFGTADND